MSLRLVMMGTGRFALPAFQALYETRHEVVALYTQPDRTGRGHHRHVNPMKQHALERGTPVFQPPNVNQSEALDELRSLRADLCVVAAYGQILSADMLEIPRHGAINLHASLLPRHRGAAPVQYAVLRGDERTGVTIFQIDPRLDAGPVLGVVETPIETRETAGELETRLAALAAPLTLDVIDSLEAGTAVPQPQDSSRATRAPRMQKSFGAIDWSRPSEEIERHVRATQPWPKSFTFLIAQGRPPLRLIVLSSRVADESEPLPPGRVSVAAGERLLVGTGRRNLEIERLRPEGKSDMTAAEFLHGHRFGPQDFMDAEPPSPPLQSLSPRTQPLSPRERDSFEAKGEEAG